MNTNLRPTNAPVVPTATSASTSPDRSRRRVADTAPASTAAPPPDEPTEILTLSSGAAGAAGAPLESTPTAGPSARREGAPTGPLDRLRAYFEPAATPRRAVDAALREFVQNAINRDADASLALPVNYGNPGPAGVGPDSTTQSRLLVVA